MEAVPEAGGGFFPGEVLALEAGVVDEFGTQGWVGIELGHAGGDAID